MFYTPRYSQMAKTACCLTVSILFIVMVALPVNTAHAALFGYRETTNTNLDIFPQWVSVLERHIKEDVPEGNCESSTFNTCHMKEWYAFLESIKHESRQEQMDQVNAYANEKSYVLDIDNYGVEDYWAIVKEFLYNSGDCEDYSIFKFMSFRWLGFKAESMRIVVLEDINLGIAHAVLALYTDDDILIFDNQTEEIVSHKDISHYVPIYSVNESRWWMHLPS